MQWVTRLLDVAAAHEVAWRTNHAAVGVPKARARNLLSEMAVAETEWRDCCRRARMRPPSCGCGNCPDKVRSIAAAYKAAKEQTAAAERAFKAGVTPDQLAAAIGAR